MRLRNAPCWQTNCTTFRGCSSMRALNLRLTAMSLMTVDQLTRRRDDPRLRIVDTRWYLLRPGDGRAAYEAGHIPGAIHLDLDTDLSAVDGPGRHPLPAPAEFRSRMEAVGIGTDHSVVAYDDA